MILKSNKENISLHAMFPTLIYQASLESHLQYKAALEAVFDDHSFEVDYEKGSPHLTGEYHGKILLHQEAQLQPFFEELARHVASYLNVMRMRTDVYSLNVLKSWLVVCPPNKSSEDAIRPHCHSCSDISFVYYASVPEKCPEIAFHTKAKPNTALYDSAFHADFKNEDRNSIHNANWWNTDEQSVEPKEGDLILFPGHQLHSVESNRTESTRVTVAGDLALIVKPEYKNLEFGRTSPDLWKEFELDAAPPTIELDDFEANGV